MSLPTVYYQPVRHGLSNAAGDKPIIYHGKAYRVPRSAHGTVQQLEWEIPPRELPTPITRDDGVSVYPVEGAVIERFEIVDRDTGDLWVMYRVPYPTED